jgi:hypothetical protein
MFAGRRMKRSERSTIWTSSIPRPASPIFGSPSADLRISQCSLMACDQQDCWNDDSVQLEQNPIRWNRARFPAMARPIALLQHADPVYRTPR